MNGINVLPCPSCGECYIDWHRVSCSCCPTYEVYCATCNIGYCDSSGKLDDVSKDSDFISYWNDMVEHTSYKKDDDMLGRK